MPTIPQGAVAVHGAGYLGVCTALHFAHRTPRQVFLYDSSLAKQAALQEGRCPVPGLEAWGGYRVEPVVANGRMVPTREPPNGDAAEYHFVCVPTHVDGDEPHASMKYVDQALTAIFATQVPPRVVVIESTLPPWETDAVVARITERGSVAVIATRRDWFAESKWNLRATPRVAWASAPEGYALLREVCDDVREASTARAASMVKVVENALYHVQIAFAQNMALAFPDTDTVELMRLVGSHPSRPMLHPSGRAGGYCVPFGTRTVLEAAERLTPDLEVPLAALEDALRTNHVVTARVYDLAMQAVLRRTGRGPHKVFLLGITYRPDTKVTAESLSRALARKLGPDRCVAFDPWYSESEVLAELGVAKGDPANLGDYPAVVVGTAHAEFTQWFRGVDPVPFKPGTLVIDSLGAWEHARERFAAAGVDYRRVGDARWTRMVRGQVGAEITPAPRPDASTL